MPGYLASKRRKGGRSGERDRTERDRSMTVKQNASGANLINREPLGADGTGGVGNYHCRLTTLDMLDFIPYSLKGLIHN